MALDQTTASGRAGDRTSETGLPLESLPSQRCPRRCTARARLRRWLQPAVAAALDRLFACLVAGGAGAFFNALKHHVARKHGTGGLRGVFQGRLKNQVGAAREKQGRKACSTFLIVDAQSVKNSDTAGQKGYDAGKKVSGIKRHIAVDTQGFPHAVAVTTAEVTDRQGALEALKRCRSGLGRVKSLLCDSGYTGDPFAEGVQDLLGKHVTVQIAKRSELHTFKVMPKRWIVERSFAWLEKNRRRWKNCERRLNTSLQFIHLAFLALLLRRS
ncbi:IS5 family transposase [Xanthomonas oryzae]|uniref:IS5 family transposase n=2 Tax=Xanthomonas oryzae TaxID=347 RepID=UPI001A921262|nr:IS5 family transposase [Xanthomonas oryzae]